MLKPLHLYMQLHRTARKVHNKDIVTLNKALEKLRSEYDSNRGLVDEDAIKEKIELGEAVKIFLLKNVVQFEQVGEDRYRANIREEHLMDNSPNFKDDISKAEYRDRVKSHRSKTKACSEPKTNC